MKKVIAIAILCISQFVNAQVTKSLGDFSTVKVFDQINVTLVQSDENKIVITGNRADEVVLVTKRDVLKIKMEFTKLLAGEDIEATLYYKNIEAIEANEGSFVSSQDTFGGTYFELNAKEGATIKIGLDVRNLESKITSGGIIELYGECDNHDCVINSGGVLVAKSFITKQTKVSVSAGGEADVYASDFVKAKTRAGGDINVYGDPSQVNKKTFAGGRIKIK
ncbi:head GIN domain-containing protein [uncultured Flavobacterium sp.]|uniref:head GIN domain-containing protein n=1 Tax=uncultured Flavobacterium sp. TaxID=165435 RepID=UPI0025E169FA|nr:head GIN domain-containing protein [uncultured Flavobacterium sp.]